MTQKTTETTQDFQLNFFTSVLFGTVRIFHIISIRFYYSFLCCICVIFRASLDTTLSSPFPFRYLSQKVGCLLLVVMVTL